MKGRPLTPCAGMLLTWIRISGSRSMKDRRRVIQSLLEKIRGRWNVSAVDIGPDGSWTEANLAFSAAASALSMAEERLEAVYSFLTRMEETGEFTIIGRWREVTCYDDISDAENQQTDAKGDIPPPGTEGKE